MIDIESGKKKALIVDEYDGWSKLVIEAGKDNGFDVSEADSAEKGIEQVGLGGNAVVFSASFNADGFIVLGKAVTEGARPVLLTGDPDMIDTARKFGLEVIDKGDKNALESIYKVFIAVGEEIDDKK